MNRCQALIGMVVAVAAGAGSLMGQVKGPLYRAESYTVWPDRVEQGGYTARVLSEMEMESTYPLEGKPAGTVSRRALQPDFSRFPKATSDIPLMDALYNLSVDDLGKDINSDDTLQAGAKWQGVWTRDISYSIVLAVAMVAPDAAKTSLLKKVKRDRIVQDTGTGGSWPVSSDRVTWALAAWEVYLTTGDRGWLERSYRICSNTLADDEATVFDGSSGLMHGETSFLDWREQTYPRWMQPADIYQAEALSTNVVYVRVYSLLAMMAKELGEPHEVWTEKASRLQTAVRQHLWLPDFGYFGQYRYGRGAVTVSPRADALGNVLAVFFDVASDAQQRQILLRQPVQMFGIATVYPQTPAIVPYHNRSVWPFVQAFWNLAAAKLDDGDALLAGMSSIARSTALLLTNKENFVLESGDPAGTAVSSDRQLWSVAGNLAMTYRVLFGLRYEADGLHLHPVIPQALGGKRQLTGLRYRDAVVDVTVEGYGSTIASTTLDGKPSEPFLPASAAGHHSFVLRMEDHALSSVPHAMAANMFAPDTPSISIDGMRLHWDAVEGATEYRVYRDGKRVRTTAMPEYALTQTQFASPGQYQSSAVRGGVESFRSEPFEVGPAPVQAKVEGGKSVAAGTESTVNLQTIGVTGAVFPADVASAGTYRLTVRYSNGNGPVNTDNRCAIRSLYVDGKRVGAVVMPQRGENAWNLWGESSAVSVHLDVGAHRFELRYDPTDENMNGDVNQAHVSAIVMRPVIQP